MPAIQWSDDPVRDAARYAEEVADWERRFPICPCCDEHIVEGEDYTDVMGEPIHWECFEKEHRQVMSDEYSV